MTDTRQDEDRDELDGLPRTLRLSIVALHTEGHHTLANELTAWAKAQPARKPKRPTAKDGAQIVDLMAALKESLNKAG